MVYMGSSGNGLLGNAGFILECALAPMAQKNNPGAENLRSTGFFPSQKEHFSFYSLNSNTIERAKIATPFIGC